MRVFYCGLACPIMKADGSVDVVVAFRRVEEEFYAAIRFLPLVADNRLHNISLRLFVLSQYCCRSVCGLQLLPCVVEKFLISDKVPVRLLVLEFNFDKVLPGAEVNNGLLESRLEQTFNRPSFAALIGFLAHNPGAGAVDNFFNLLLPFAPTKSERRIDMVRISWLSVRKAEQFDQKP
jgi:hypothetical protein